ncbi:unnamed protein product, partial [Rhizoctonia solani]
LASPSEGVFAGTRRTGGGAKLRRLLLSNAGGRVDDAGAGAGLPPLNEDVKAAVMEDVSTSPKRYESNHVSPPCGGRLGLGESSVVPTFLFGGAGGDLAPPPKEEAILLAANRPAAFATTGLLAYSCQSMLSPADLLPWYDVQHWLRLPQVGKQLLRILVLGKLSVVAIRSIYIKTIHSG